MKAITTYDIYKKIRKTWESLNPRTRVKGNDKKYDRNISKRELNKIRKMEDF